jgi:hypothetical protein
MDNGIQPSMSEFGDAMFCIGYIRAVLDEIWEQQNFPEAVGIKSISGATTCMADSISNEQAAKVAKKYLQDNPARLHLPADLLIREALEKAFPCK